PIPMVICFPDPNCGGVKVGFSEPLILGGDFPSHNQTQALQVSGAVGEVARAAFCEWAFVGVPMASARG
ncbi:MAG: hypothetical protein ACPHF4_03145, partial [Rubripirellula sp.]